MTYVDGRGKRQRWCSGRLKRKKSRVFGCVEVQSRTGVYIGKELKVKTEVVVGRNMKARLIRPVGHSEVKISAEEDREEGGKGI